MAKKSQAPRENSDPWVWVAVTTIAVAAAVAVGATRAGSSPMDRAATALAATALLLALVWQQRARLLRRRQQQYRTMFEANPLAMWIFDTGSHRFLAANAAACAQYGYSRAEFAGMTLPALLAEDEWKRERERLEQEPGVHTRLARHRRKDGSTLEVEIVSHPVVWEGQRARMTLARNVDDVRRAELAVRRSEEQLRLVMEATGEGILSLDLAGDCVWCNRAAARQLGYGVPEELIGQNLHRLAHHTRANGEPYPEAACAVMRAARAGEGVALMEELLWRRDGSRFHTEFRSYPVLRGGAPAGVVVNFHDIERQREAERALAESEARMQALAESGIVGLSLSAAGGRIMRANATFLRMTGFNRADLAAGRVRWDSDSTVGDPVHFAAVARTLAAGKPVPPFYSELQHKNGTRVPVLLGLVPGKEGTIRLTLDVSDLRRAQQSLAVAERRYQELFERNLAGVFSVTPEGRILAANPAWARLTGFGGRAALEAAPALQIFPELPALVEELRSSGAVVNREMELRRPDGTKLTVLANVSLLPADADLPERLEGTLVDLTEYKQLEREFQQAQKLEGIGLLAGGVAHDFNNLLTVINGYSEMLLNQTGLGTEERRGVEAIAVAGGRATGLTRQLMAFSRRQSLELAVLDLNRMLEHSQGLLQRLLGERYRLRLRLGRKLPQVKADATQLEQVVMNLVVNARDAMPAGGEIVITTGRAGAGGKSAAARPVDAAAPVMLAVTDTGVGMDEATRSRIFEPFFTTKERGRGTGLGLATVFGIVKQSGGTIAVDSEPGRGTTMRVCLPAIAAAEEETPVTAEPQATRGHETLLLVEDESAVREYVVEVLREQGYEVLAADGAEAALGLSRERGAGIDLLVTDIVMPGMDGPALAERLLRERPGLRVLLVSGYPSHALEAQRELPATTAFLQKPYTAQAITARIRAVLDGEPERSAAPAG